MKQTIIIILVFLMGCGPSKEEIEIKEKEEGKYSKNGLKTSFIAGQDFQIIILDSCEYIYHSGNHSESLIHKANCKNH